jgi:hypothetical protein
MEYLLTERPYRTEIAELPNDDIERLRTMVGNAVRLGIPPEEIYEAIMRGFDQVMSPPVPSPPLAYQLDEQSNIDEELRALVKLSQTVKG